jgi:3-dehydroquinate synthase
MVFQKSKITTSSKLPAGGVISEESFIIFDQKLKSYAFFKKWVSPFKNQLAIASGESLKTLKNFNRLIELVHKKVGPLPKNQIHIIAVGGGSIGDTVGFLASVYKRGVRLSHIPTTWLSVLDSAHGGKTALNINSSKNQMGTYYPAQNIFIVKKILPSQPSESWQNALGEILKMSLLNKKVFNLLNKKNINPWSLATEVINAKMTFVKKDPFETHGLRTFLNLGHTMGHALELNLNLPHGRAVGYGLLFSLQLSFDKKLMSKNKKNQLSQFIEDKMTISIKDYKKSLHLKSIMKAMKQDKKNSKPNSITFVALKNIAKPCLIQINQQDVEKSLRNLNWLK